MCTVLLPPGVNPIAVISISIIIIIIIIIGAKGSGEEVKI
jgi:hypothetical protein